jgi:hypothetical protein
MLNVFIAILLGNFKDQAGRHACEERCHPPNKQH